MKSERGKLESPWPCLRRDLLTSSSWTLCWPKARSDDKCRRTWYNCMSSDYIDSCEANTMPHDGQRCQLLKSSFVCKKLFGKVESASSKMCVRTSRPITWMVPPWPRYVQACVDIKELPPGCNFDVVSYCCTTLHNPFCCKTQAGQGNLMRLHEGNLKCSLGKLYEWSNGSTILFNSYIQNNFDICDLWPAASNCCTVPRFWLLLTTRHF